MAGAAPDPATERRPLASLRCGHVGPAPLPPHERPWRHPSELGPPEHEPTAGGGRLLIVTTATFGLVLVALLAVAVTPSSTTSTDAPPTVAAVRAAPASLVPASLVHFEPEIAAPMVAPVGLGGLALTTAAAVRGMAGELTVQLPSGQAVDAAVMSVDESRDIAVVSLPESVPTETFAVAADASPPVPADTVLVHSAEPIVVAVANLSTLEVSEGTPVSDGAGNLVGLCTLDEISAELTLTGVAVNPDELVDATVGSD